MQKVQIAKEPAILVAVKDSSLHPFMQRYPFLNGDDAVARKTALSRVRDARDAIIVRTAASDVEITRLNEQDVKWWTDEEDRAKRVLKAKGLSDAEADVLWSEFSWKMKAVPHDAKRILSIGCGGGAELFFLRLRAPNATIKAADWGNALRPEFSDVEGVEFSIQDLTKIREFPERNFDVIFSNHVIEHLYAPDETLAEIRELLAPGGAFISAVPLDGQGDVAFKDSLRKLSESPDSFGAMDVFMLNFGHPWKTNFSDLNQTLHGAGFGEVELFQREWSVLRSIPYNEEQWRKRLATALSLHAALVRPAQKVAKTLFGAQPPLIVTRAFESLERRLSFGSNRIACDLSMETLFVARITLAVPPSPAPSAAN